MTEQAKTQATTEIVTATAKLTTEDYKILDEADAEQIAMADAAVRQALCYDLGHKGKQISFAGIKMLTLKMSQEGQPLSIIEADKPTLEKHDPDDKSTWVWYASCKVRNETTRLESVGFSSSPWQIEQKKWENGRQVDSVMVDDPFAFVKAASKAERNATRKQIPETEINYLLTIATEGQTQRLNGRGGAGNGNNRYPAVSAEQKQKALDNANRCKCETPVPGHVITGGAYEGVAMCKNCSSFILRREEAVEA